MSKLPEYVPRDGQVMIRTVEFFNPNEPVYLTSREASWIEGMYSKGLSDAQVRGIVGQSCFDAYQKITQVWQPST